MTALTPDPQPVTENDVVRHWCVFQHLSDEKKNETHFLKLLVFAEVDTKVLYVNTSYSRNQSVC